MRLRFSQDLFEAGDLGGEDVAADAGEAIVAAAGVAIVGGSGGGSGGFFDEAMAHQFFEVVVEGAGAELVLALRLACDFLHDAVAVEVVGSEGEEDVELRGGEREEGVERVLCVHGRKPIYRNPSMVVKTQEGWYWKKVDSRQLKVERGGKERSRGDGLRPWSC
jgi:hypothetical protein